MKLIPSFPMIRRWALLVAFIGLCFLLGLIRRVFL